MRCEGALSLLLGASLAFTVKSFNVDIPNLPSHEIKQQKSLPPRSQQQTCAAMTSQLEGDEESPVPEPKPDLVSQKTFKEAIEVIEREMARQQGVEFVPKDDSNIHYAIGRITTSLPIPPGIDLIETQELVLINGVAQSAIDSGIKPLDTIVGVTVEGTDFIESTLGMNMDDMAKVITGAVAFAKENGKSELGLELNRLIKGFYK